LLKKHSQFFESLLFIADIFIIAASWFFSYYLRFYSGLIPSDKGIPPLKVYAFLIIPIIFIWGFAFKAFGLYRPKRISSYASEAFDITKACIISVLILVSVTFFFRQYEFSRLVFLFFAGTNIIALSLERWLFREILRYLRRKGYNIRHALIVGAGELAEGILKRIEMHPEIGIKVMGVLSTNGYEIEKDMERIKVIGTYEDIREIIKGSGIETVIIALGWKEHGKVVDVLKKIEDEVVDIKVIPDIYEFMTLRGGIEELEGLPIISLQGTALYGWNVVIKRIIDIVVSLIAILITFPIMVIISIIIKLSSQGPVIFKQRRYGLDGKVIWVYKFRTMIVREDGPYILQAEKGDQRLIQFGVFLRRTSLDELPQFFNVLQGSMSVVGPRPHAIAHNEQYRKIVKSYMLRHKVRPGITGWAQVNGWRGETDTIDKMEKRIEYDLYYIENWSFWFDMKIIWLTLWKGFINKSAY